MFSQRQTSLTTEAYYSSIRGAVKCIEAAHRILIGVGSGLSAAGGLDYNDPALVAKWYPEYAQLGKRSIMEILGDYWANALDERNVLRFWGIWARHIFHIRYEPQVTGPYMDLFHLVKHADYFICSTNADGQLGKAGFEKDRIFAPQGDYSLFQCQHPCSLEVYDNKEMIDRMIANMPSAFEIRPEDIPRCPRCGSFLIPNLRADRNFVEKPHVKNAEQYEAFINGSYGEKLVLLELGVGYNTPGIIRYPFEHITKGLLDATLIRINNTDANVPRGIVDRSICIQGNLKQVLCDMTNSAPN